MSIYIGDKEIKNLFVGESISISDMQGPCPDGFHIPTYDEVVALRTLGYNIGAWEQYGSGTNLYRYLKTHGSASGYNPNEIQGTDAVWGAISTTMYRTSTFDGANYYYWYCDETHMSAAGSYGNNGFFIRPFRNNPITPDNNWTVLYQGTGSAGIYHNSTLGLISIGNGTTWITIADKNLGATTVYNYGDTFSQANCGNCYQRGNNYGFPYGSTISSTTTKVNASTYGPGNYYSSSVYVKGGNKTYWDTSKNQNLWGGVTQGTTETGAAKAVYLGENKVRPSTMPAGIYHNATLGLISLSSDGENWITIADKNLGATQVWNGGDTLTDGNCGKIYQWGNNYGFPRTGTISTSSSKTNASTYGPGNYYSSSTFRYGPGSYGYYYWDSSHSTNLWGGTTGTNEAMRGPCDAGFHIPNATELQSLVSNVNTLGISSDYNIYLKIPLCAGRSGQNGSKNTSSVTWLWSANSVYNTSHSYDTPTVIVISSTAFRVQTDASGNGHPIRPFKNEAVQPNSSRTKLN